MTLFGLIFVLVFVGVVMYLINEYVPMAPKIKSLLNVAVVILLILWIMQGIGMLGPINNIWVR